ncbi:MAG: globin domain-containing protein [Rhodomicrobium sp.]
MSPARLAALRAFFASIEARLPSAVDEMYGQLFEEVPEAIPLFKGDLQEQKQRFRFMLLSIIKLTRSSHLWPVCTMTGRATLPSLNELKSRHADAGVTPAHFEVMKILLTKACEHIAPAEFTPEIAESLAFVFDVLARSLTVSDSASEALARKDGPPAQDTAAGFQDPSSYFDHDVPDKDDAGRA